MKWNGKEEQKWKDKKELGGEVTNEVEWEERMKVKG